MTHSLKTGIQFDAPLTKEQLRKITADAKANLYTTEEYFAFCLNNWDDVMRCMESNASRRAMKVAKPLMKLAIGRK